MADPSQVRAAARMKKAWSRRRGALTRRQELRKGRAASKEGDTHQMRAARRARAHTRVRAAAARWQVLYAFPDGGIDEIKVSPGIMLLMMARDGGRLPLQVRCIETGA
eukprot:2703852-Prymnesium_polylepis.1